MRQPSEIINNPEIVKPTEYSEEIQTKEYKAPSRQVYYQPIYEKQIVNNKEQVEFVEQEDEIVNLDPVTRQPVLRVQPRTESITRPGRIVENQTLIQPTIQRERVDVQINRQPDQEVMLKPITEAVLVNNVSREETVKIPGKQIITQPIV